MCSQKLPIDRLCVPKNSLSNPVNYHTKSNVFPKTPYKPGYVFPKTPYSCLPVDNFLSFKGHKI